MDTFVEGIAYGLFVMRRPISEDHGKMWHSMDDRTRDNYRAKARFLLSYANQVPRP